MKLTKRLIALFMSFMMLIGAMPLTAITAYAEDEYSITDATGGELIFRENYLGDIVSSASVGQRIWVFPKDYIGDDGEGSIIESITITDEYGNEVKTNLQNIADFTMPAADVTVTATVSEKKYMVTAYYNECGSYDRISDYILKEGETYKATVTPLFPYLMSKLYAEDKDGNQTDLIANGSYNAETGELSFAMPPKPLTIYQEYITDHDVCYIYTDKESKALTQGYISYDLNQHRLAAHKGDDVTLNVVINDSNYALTSLHYIDKNDNQVDLMPSYNKEDGTFTFTMPDSDITLYYSFDQLRKIVLKEVEGGTVTCNAEYAAIGDTVTLTFHPDDGYKLYQYDYDYYSADDKWFNGGESYAYFNNKNSYDFYISTQGETDSYVVITPEFRKSYNIVNEGDTELNFRHSYGGDNITEGVPGETVYVFPKDYLYDDDEGYLIESITVTDAQGNNIPVELNNYASFTMPNSAVTVTAALSKYKYNITTNYSPIYSDGYVRIISSSALSEGETFIGEVVPYSHYVLKEMYYLDKNGTKTDIMNNGSYNPTTSVVSFRMPASPIKIYTTFSVEEYTIKWDANGNVTETSVPYNTVPQCSETPASYLDNEKHYTFSAWSDGENIYASDEIPVATKDATYTAVYTAEAHNFGGPEWTWAEDNSSATASFTCSVCGKTADVNAVITAENKRETITYTASAEFEGNTYTDTKTVNKELLTVAVVPPENGTVTANLNEAYEGDEVMLTVTPNSLYELESLSVRDANENEITVTEDKFIMPASNVTVTAEFKKLQLVAEVEPHIDENGAYIPGNVAYYASSKGINYAINEDGSVGEVLDSVELSYFDFELMKDDTYRVNFYTGPTAELTEIVIPKTYKGKKITVVGSASNEIFYETDKTQFTLVLNENITEIAPYTFYALWVKEVKGDTSSLNEIGNYAFSWANSPDGYATVIHLDYPGEITVHSGAFYHMHITAYVKHATTLSRKGNSQSISYVFTDDHTYGEPEWTWAADCSSADVIFKCTDSRCNHQKALHAAVSYEDKDNKRIYTATAEDDGITYTNSKTITNNLWVGGQAVNMNNCNDILGDGTASYDLTTNTLTLTDATIEIQQYNSSAAFGIRYNTSIDIPFHIVLNGTNRIVDNTADSGVTEKFGICEYASSPGYTISGSGTLDISMSAVDEGVSYYGIQARKALTLDGTTLTVNILGAEKTTGVDMWYNDAVLSLVNNAVLNINTGSNGETYALASNRNVKNVSVEEGSALTAISENSVANSNINLTDETKALGALVNKNAKKAGSVSWDKETALGNYKYILVPDDNTGLDTAAYYAALDDANALADAGLKQYEADSAETFRMEIAAAQNDFENAETQADIDAATARIITAIENLKKGYIEPEYKGTCNIIGLDGVIIDKSGTAEYEAQYDEKIYLLGPADCKFAYTDADGSEIYAYLVSNVLYAPKNNTIYIKAVTTITEGKAYIAGTSFENRKARYNCQYSIPDDATFVETGIVMSFDKSATLEIGADGARAFKATKIGAQHEYSITFNISDANMGKTIYGKCYVTYTDKNGYTKTVYSEQHNILIKED